MGSHPEATTEADPLSAHNHYPSDHCYNAADYDEAHHYHHSAQNHRPPDDNLGRRYDDI
jgi:hypothetical protein